MHQLERCSDHNGPHCWKLIEVAQAGQTELASPMHRRMVGERRIEAAGLPGVGADRLDADAKDVPVPREDSRRVLMESRRVRPVLADVQKFLRRRPPAPPGSEQHPRVLRHAAVRFLPSLEVLRRQQIVRVRLDLARDVDDARRPDEPTRLDRVARVVRQVLARDPVYRRVEMRARMLPHVDRVPVPGRTLVVVLRDDVDRHTGRRRENRRQSNDRRVGPERLREVDDAQPTGVELGDELLENGGHHEAGCAVRAPAFFSQRWNSNRFSSSARSVTKPAGPLASTFATIVVSSCAAMASSNAATKSWMVRTVTARGMPAAAAMAVMSLPVDVAVGNPPTESRLSLSNTTCTRLRGRYRASVVRPPRFMSTDPSPSNTTTDSSGRVSATPRPIDDASPMACWR